MDFSKYTREEKEALLNKAKSAYYNGEEIISDAEYDQLEVELGLENKNYIGSKQGNYTVKHAFLCGSLSKTQVKEQRDGSINWESCVNDINTYLNKGLNVKFYETTPKLDGCSFSAEFKNVNGKAYVESVATRGNGEWGSDIKHWFNPVLETEYWNKIDDAVSALCDENSNDILCVRGEVLVKQSDFSKKYVDLYANPRAFVAGMLGLKYGDATEEKIEFGKDLHFVCYDYRIQKTKGQRLYEELSWMNPNDPSYNRLKPFLGHIGELPDEAMCRVCKYDGYVTVEDFVKMYDDYDAYRKNDCDYALDGIVFKPACESRQYNEFRPRPVDCIAVKFLPMINATKIVDIEWNVRKTGEYFPTGIVDPITMPDGKKITRASLHNYGWIIANECGIGSSVRISLAGDIIPFVYEIVEHEPTEDNINLPEDGNVVTEIASGARHYMKKFSDEELEKNKFLNSCMTLNINTVGPAAAEDLYDALHNDIPELINIIYLMNEESYHLIYDYLGTGKSIQNIVENIKKFAGHITLVDVIRSFNFKQCGNKASEVCAKILSGSKYSTASLPGEAYKWALNKDSKEYYMVMKAVEDLGIDIEIMEDDIDDSEKILVILTGSPEEFGYKTKGAFMQAHPNLKETTSWKEIQMLITDDLDSTSGKMKKAQKAGIPIKTYGQLDIENESVDAGPFKNFAPELFDDRLSDKIDFNTMVKQQVELF